MSVLSTLTITFDDDASEQRFVAAFGKALEMTDDVPGLERLVAAKVLGRDRTYHLHTEWQSSEPLEAWLANPDYRRAKASAGDLGVGDVIIKRWEPSTD
jgi:heme-degrading monooxygenase HmoA